MKNAKAALIWIADILKKQQIRFQISGGLAAIAYGANRPLADIDIDIPEINSIALLTMLNHTLFMALHVLKVINGI